MDETEVVSCHTCGAEVASVRSVMLRLLPGKKLVHLIIAPGLVSKQLVELDDHRWIGPHDPAYLNYRKNVAQCRSFICEKCYGMLDTLDGLAEIERDGKVMLWSIQDPPAAIRQRSTIGRNGSRTRRRRRAAWALK